VPATSKYKAEQEREAATITSFGRASGDGGYEHQVEERASIDVGGVEGRWIFLEAVWALRIFAVE